MAKVKFVLNLPGLNELMKSGEMQAVLNSAAAQIAGAAGEGYETESAHPLSFAAIASVRAATYDSYFFKSVCVCCFAKRSYKIL